jgi:hypothetical protein
VRAIQKREPRSELESAVRAARGQEDALGCVGERAALRMFVVGETSRAEHHMQRDDRDIRGYRDAGDDRQLHVQATTERGGGGQQLCGLEDLGVDGAAADTHSSSAMWPSWSAARAIEIDALSARVGCVVAHSYQPCAPSSAASAGGGFEFLARGRTPVSLEIPTTARLLNPIGRGGFGPEFIGQIPLVETVPGAPYASVETIEITLGAAYRKHGKPVYYGTVPKTCPAGGFRVKAEFTFAENGDVATPQTVPFRAPCPTK